MTPSVGLMDPCEKSGSEIRLGKRFYILSIVVDCFLGSNYVFVADCFFETEMMFSDLVEQDCQGNHYTF